MNNSDKRKFAELMAGMGEVFQKDVSKGMMKIYWNALEGMDIDDISKAVSHIVMTRTITGTLPLPAEIIQAAEGNPEEKAELAWRTLIKTIQDHGFYDSVQFEDGAIGETVKALGGWLRISGFDDDWTEGNLKWRRKEFLNLYHSFARQKPGPVKLIGYHEGNNTGKHDDFIPQIIFVGRNGQYLQLENDSDVKQITAEPDIVKQIAEDFEF